MSRQADNIRDFEIYGEQYSFIEPTNLEELMKAYELRDIIQNYYSNLMHDDDTKDSWLSCLQEQEGYIKDYLDSLGEFDNKVLVGNVTFLAKKNGMRFGDLESALGLSAGYISRTAKADSKKKMSIDVVWKMSRLFDIDIKVLLERDLSLPERSMDLLVKFIEKLKSRTIENEITWLNHGGYATKLDRMYKDLGLITDSKKDYRPGEEVHLYNMHWVGEVRPLPLTNDIFCLPDFQNGKDLAIISCETVDHYEMADYILIWQDGFEEKWERLFCTGEDAFADLTKMTKGLVDIINGMELEPLITKKQRSVIEAFLKGDN